jgi:hypothetical protein
MPSRRARMIGVGLHMNFADLYRALHGQSAGLQGQPPAMHEAELAKDSRSRASIVNGQKQVLLSRGPCVPVIDARA